MPFGEAPNQVQTSICQLLHRPINHMGNTIESIPFKEFVFTQDVPPICQVLNIALLPRFDDDKENGGEIIRIRTNLLLLTGSDNWSFLI